MGAQSAKRCRNGAGMTSRTGGVGGLIIFSEMLVTEDVVDVSVYVREVVFEHNEDMVITIAYGDER